ncbi:MAG: phytoene desaturase family protein, partial [Planctomycetaceae bacterium]
RNYDVGLHAVTNCAPPGRPGPLNKILRQLRFSRADFDLAPQTGSAVAFPGVTLRFGNDFEQLRQEVREQFPAQADGFERLLKRIDGHDDTTLDPPPLSTRAVLGECLTDPLLVDMLLCPLMFYGSPTPDDIDFTQFVILFKSIYYEGFGRPREGVRRILKVLTRRYKSLGGELRLRSGVESVRTRDGRAVGVTLENGEEIDARSVLSSAGVAETMRLCGGPVSRDERFRPGEISFVEAIFTLDRTPAELGFDRTILFYSRSPRFRYARPAEPVDVESGIICSPNNYRYREPLDEGKLRLTALANPAHWMNLPEEEYLAAKEHWCRRIVASALDHLPDFRPHVVDTDMFTPRTIRQFTGHVNGCVYGAPRKFLDGRTPVEGLYLCGTDQGYLGIIGAMISGISVATMHLLR